MNDVTRAALILGIGLPAGVIALLVFTRAASFLLVNTFAWLTMRPGVRYNGWRWDVVRRYVYDRDHGACRDCGATYRLLHCHHKRPVTEGGSYQTWNLETLCHRCHASRHPENRSMWK